MHFSLLQTSMTWHKKQVLNRAVSYDLHFTSSMSDIRQQGNKTSTEQVNCVPKIVSVRTNGKVTLDDIGKWFGAIPVSDFSKTRQVQCCCHESWLDSDPQKSKSPRHSGEKMHKCDIRHNRHNSVWGTTPELIGERKIFWLLDTRGGKKRSISSNLIFFSPI